MGILIKLLPNRRLSSASRVGFCFSGLLIVVSIWLMLYGTAAQSQMATANYYVSPTGSDSNDGRTLNTPFRTIGQAAAVVQPGQLVHIRGGVYAEYLVLSKGGTNNSSRVTFEAYPGEKPIIDGSGRKTNVNDPWQSPDNLVNVQGSYITLRGLEVRNAASFGIYIRGNYVVIDQVHGHNNYFASVYFYMSSYGTVTNSILHDSYDYGPGGVGGGGNADCLGSSASNSPTTVYGYHTFRNNLIYNCSDDGIDTWTSQFVTIEHNVVHHAGFSNASNGGSNSIGQATGNGNGYKLGGNNVGGKHIVRYNVAYSNLVSGFDDNSGSGIQLINNTAYNTGSSFEFWTSGNILKNNLAYGGSRNVSSSSTQNNNSWNLNITNPNFMSTNPSDPNFLRLSPTSPAIDAGVDIGGPYSGTAPDLGAYEAGDSPPAPPQNLRIS